MDMSKGERSKIMIEDKYERGIKKKVNSRECRERKK